MSDTIKGLLLPAGLIAAAEIAGRLIDFHSDSLAIPSAIVMAFFEAVGDGSLLTATRDTLAGAFAGLGMSATVLGYKGYFEIGLGSGAGFAGVAVALLGRGHPAGIVGAAIFFGTLEQAGLAINARVPKEAMTVLEAVAIVLVSAAGRFAKSADASADASAEPTGKGNAGGDEPEEAQA